VRRVGVTPGLLQQALPVQGAHVQVPVLEGTGHPLQHASAEPAFRLSVHELGRRIGADQGGGGTGAAGAIHEAESGPALHAARLEPVDEVREGGAVQGCCDVR